MIIATIVSFLAGVTVVVSRTTNAKLAEETSLFKSTFYNYIIGLICSSILLFVVHFFIEPQFSNSPFYFQLNYSWIYLGGALGVFAVSISNIVVSKISSFYVTLLMFIGQVFTGIVLDIIISKTFSLGNLLGGIFVTIGLILNLWFDKNEAISNND